MTIWAELMKQLLSSSGRSKRGSVAPRDFAFINFYEEHYEDIFQSIRHAEDLKLRVSITGLPVFGGLNYSAIVRKLFVLSDLIIFSPASVLSCKLIGDSRFGDMTIGGLMAPPRDNMPGHCIRFHSGRNELLSLFLKAKTLVGEGQLGYLPGYSVTDDIYNWSFRGEDFGDSYADDRFERQVKRIAQDIYVSHRLGCVHVFPSALNAPLGISQINTPDMLGLVIASLKIPIIR